MADFGEKQRIARGELDNQTDNDYYLLILIPTEFIVKKKLSHGNSVTTSPYHPGKEGYHA